MKPIDDEKLKTVCKIGQGKDCCRYLACGTKGFECMKNTYLAKLLDSRVKACTMTAQGDNCDGNDMPDFKKVFNNMLGM